MITFNNISLAGNGIIKIYSNSDNAGTPVLTINASNDQDIIGTDLVLKGDMTISFQGSTLTQSQNPIDIRYVTGDHVFTTYRSRRSAVWKAFVTPNSYLAVDDMSLTLTSSLDGAGEKHAPICVAYFDANKISPPVRSDFA